MLRREENAEPVWPLVSKGSELFAAGCIMTAGGLTPKHVRLEFVTLLQRARNKRAAADIKYGSANTRFERRLGHRAMLSGVGTVS